VQGIRRIRALAIDTVTESLGASLEVSVARPSFLGAIRLSSTGRSKALSVVAIRLTNNKNRVDARSGRS